MLELEIKGLHGQGVGYLENIYNTDKNKDQDQHMASNSTEIKNPSATNMENYTYEMYFWS